MGPSVPRRRCCIGDPPRFRVPHLRLAVWSCATLRIARVAPLFAKDLDLAATAFRDELAKIGVTDVHFELFDATHMGIDYRYPMSLAYLSERLR
jgi:hypothetical protein